MGIVISDFKRKEGKWKRKRKYLVNKCLLGHAETVGHSVASDPQVLFPPPSPVHILVAAKNRNETFLK